MGPIRPVLAPRERSEAGARGRGAKSPDAGLIRVSLQARRGTHTGTVLSRRLGFVVFLHGVQVLVGFLDVLGGLADLGDLCDLPVLVVLADLIGQ